MRRFVTVCILALAIPLLLPANDFDWLVREFARESGAHQIHIPIFGLVRFGVALARPAGTGELQLAVFENTGLECQRFSRITDMVVGDNWKPIIRVRSQYHESTNIYAQENGRDLRLLITSLDGANATFVQLRIRPDELIKFVDEHRNPR